MRSERERGRVSLWREREKGWGEREGRGIEEGKKEGEKEKRREIKNERGRGGVRERKEEEKQSQRMYPECDVITLLQL